MVTIVLQFSVYHALMGQMVQVTVRLSAIQREQLKQLAKKLGMRKSDIMRMALIRLANDHGIRVRPTWGGPMHGLIAATLLLCLC